MNIKIKNQRVIIGLSIIMLLGIITFWRLRAVERSYFSINTLKTNAEYTMVTDNSTSSECIVSFWYFDGTDSKEIYSEKNEYSLKIKSNQEKGNVKVEILSGDKLIYTKDGKIDETVSIKNNENKRLVVNITGEKAKGNLYIKPQRG